MLNSIVYLKREYGVAMISCWLCQTKVPCESCNPVKKLLGKIE